MRNTPLAKAREQLVSGDAAAWCICPCNLLVSGEVKSAEADYSYLDLDYSGYHKNFIQLLFIIRGKFFACWHLCSEMQVN